MYVRIRTYVPTVFIHMYVYIANVATYIYKYKLMKGLLLDITYLALEY